MNKKYDLSQFNTDIYEIDNLDDLTRIKLSNGIFNCGKDRLFDVYIENIENIENNTVLVCFNAAVTNRSAKQAPFFSGKGINRELKRTLISFADPTVSSTNVGLGWYLGNKVNQNLQKEIASFLDELSALYNCKFILFGGSGAGFASLAIASLLNNNTSAKVLVFNPQTIVTNYYFRFVKEYIECTYNVDNITNKKQASDFLEKLLVIHNINILSFKDNIEILYLQNKADTFHLENHLVPFLSPCKPNLYTNNSLMSNNQKIGIYLGKWGEGHAPPSDSIIKNILNSMMENTDITNILQQLEKGFNGESSIENGEIVYLDKDIYAIYTNLRINEGFLLVSALVKKNGVIFSSSDIKYAAYLIQGSTAIYKQFYQDAAEFSFDISELKKLDQLFVRVYIKDAFHNVMIQHSDQIN